MQPDAPKKPNRGDLKSAVMDAAHDAQVLDIVLGEANESPRNDEGAMGPVLMVPEGVFLAWMRMCNHLIDSVREVESVFYAASR